MTARMPSAVGSSIATVAVLETNADSAQVIRPNAMITRIVLWPTPGMARIRNAKRLARPCFSIDCARMKAPMNVKIVPEPNGASTASAPSSPPTPSRIRTEAPSMPDTGIGIGSVIHAMITPPSTAATVCCSCGMSSGSRKMMTVVRGASTKPAVRRLSSKRSSRSDSCCSATPLYVVPPSSACSTSTRWSAPRFAGFLLVPVVDISPPSRLSPHQHRATSHFRSPHPLVGETKARPGVPEKQAAENGSQRFTCGGNDVASVGAQVSEGARHPSGGRHSSGVF